jgi:hypothetical protein
MYHPRETGAILKVFAQKQDFQKTEKEKTKKSNILGRERGGGPLKQVISFSKT